MSHYVHSSLHVNLQNPPEKAEKQQPSFVAEMPRRPSRSQAHNGSDDKEALTLAKLAVYDDIITDILVDRVE